MLREFQEEIERLKARLAEEQKRAEVRPRGNIRRRDVVIPRPAGPAINSFASSISNNAVAGHHHCHRGRQGGRDPRSRRAASEGDR